MTVSPLHQAAFDYSDLMVPAPDGRYLLTLPPRPTEFPDGANSVTFIQRYESLEEALMGATISGSSIEATPSEELRKALEVAFKRGARWLADELLQNGQDPSPENISRLVGYT